MAGSFCYSLAKSNVFAPLTSLRDVQRKTLLPRAMGCTPFLTFTVQKIHCFFGPQKWPRKNRREQRTEKLPTAIFACPSFANKIISAALKLSSKEWSSPVARTSVRFVREPRRQKRELGISLSIIFINAHFIEKKRIQDKEIPVFLK